MRKKEGRFTYTWPLYLVLPVVLSLSISYLFYVLHRPAYYETINLFVGSASVDRTVLEKKLETEFVDNGLKEADITYSNPSDSVYAQKLSVVGFNGSDIFLVPASTFSLIDCPNVLLPFTDGFVERYLSENHDFFISDEIRYGVKIDKNSWLSSAVTFIDEDYYLCINGASKNIGDEGLYNNPEYDLALKAFVYLKGSAA